MPRCAVAVARDFPETCYGDCSGDGAVTVDEIVRATGIGLGTVEYASCPTVDATRDGQVTVDELVGALRRSLHGCPATVPRPESLGCPDGARFCNVALEAGIDVPSYGKGAAFVDVDGDDRDDIWAADSDQRIASEFGVSTLYLNLGDGRFAPVDPGIDPDHLQFNWTASFADADNDGDPDVLLVNGGFAGNGRLRLYRNDWSESGRFVDVTAASGITDELAQWWGASWADFDGDGLLDVAVNPVDGRTWLYRNAGSLRFVDVAAEQGILTDRELSLSNPVWLDFDGDGDLDLYRGGLVSDRLWRNDGAAGFTEVTTAVDFETERDLDLVFSAAAADFDQDGRDDLYFGRWSLQDLVLRSRGDGSFEIHGREVGLDMVLGDPFFQTESDPNGFENTMGLTVGDIDDDGDDDVLIGTGNPRRRFVDLAFCNQLAETGVWGFARCGGFLATGHGISQTHGMTLGDADRDGDTDLFVSIGGMAMGSNMPPAEGSRSLAAFYRSSGNGRRTAVVRLEGTTSNRDGIGADVRVESSRPYRYRVRSTQGFPSQRSLWQVLPLGDDAFGRVDVRWPSGRRCFVNVFAGERLRLIE